MKRFPNGQDWNNLGNNNNKKLLTDLENKLTVTKGERWGRDKLGVWDSQIHSPIYKIDNQQGPAVYHRELYSIFCNNLYGKRI